MGDRFRTAEWLDRGTWLPVLLFLLMLVPAATVIWFMNEAVTTQSASARQRVIEAYRGQLRLVRARIDEHWRAQAAMLQGSGAPEQRDAPEQRFAHLVTDEIAEGVVLLNDDGSVAYPDRIDAHRGAAETITARLADAERLEPAARDIPALAALLNDYTLPIPAPQRLASMRRLREMASNVSLPTQAALDLSLELIAAERPAATPGVLRETALQGVWALSSEDGRTIGLYRTGRLEAAMHDFLHQVTPSGIVFIAIPPDVMGDAEAIAAGPWMPGWQLTFQALDMAKADAAATRQARVYMAVASVGLAMMAVLGIVLGQTFRRQLRLARLKTDLVATVSHELRTPLASMRVLVDGLLADAELDPVKTREYLQMIAGENARLSRLIENFLTFSRLERSRYQFEFGVTSSSAVVDAAVDAITDRVPDGCDLRVEVEPGLPLLKADADALVTALINLLDNALKYTSAHKQILVKARRDGPAFVVFEVEDNGIGIPVREQRRIFRRFYRVDQRLAQETSGVGLGLSIVELIVRAHGGTVDVRSQPGMGSTFTVRLPSADEGAMA